MLRVASCGLRVVGYGVRGAGRVISVEWELVLRSYSLSLEWVV